MSPSEALVSAGRAAARQVFEGKTPSPTLARFCVLRHPDGTYSAEDIEELILPLAALAKLIAPVYEQIDAELIARALNAYKPPAGPKAFEELGASLRQEIERHG